MWWSFCKKLCCANIQFNLKQEERKYKEIGTKKWEQSKKKRADVACNCKIYFEVLGKLIYPDSCISVVTEWAKSHPNSAKLIFKGYLPHFLCNSSFSMENWTVCPGSLWDQLKITQSMQETRRLNAQPAKQWNYPNCWWKATIYKQPVTRKPLLFLSVKMLHFWLCEISWWT